jgi:hypothetical protein
MAKAQSATSTTPPMGGSPATLDKGGFTDGELVVFRATAGDEFTQLEAKASAAVGLGADYRGGSGRAANAAGAGGLGEWRPALVGGGGGWTGGSGGVAEADEGANTSRGRYIKWVQYPRRRQCAESDTLACC